MTRARRLALTYVPGALLVGAVGLTLVLTSDHERRPVTASVLGLLVGWSFVGSGLVAWSRRPDNRTGQLMVAVGFAWFLRALSEANASLPFTLGEMLGSVFLAFFVHLLVAYPRGRLGTRAERLLVAAAYVVALVGPSLLMLFDPEPVSDCGECPANAMLIADRPGIASAVTAVVDVAAAVLSIAIIAVLVNRWRRASVAARRAVWPVVASGLVTFVFLGLGFALHPVAEDVSNAAELLSLVSFISVPFFFLVGVLRSRLARVGATRLLVETPQTPTLDEAQDALRRALHDPTLELAYWMPDQKTYVDTEGKPVTLPSDGNGRATTMIEYEDRCIAALVHDAALRDEPELLEEVAAAARLGLEKDRLEAELRARLVELRASRKRIVEAGDAERRRLERNLHDGAQQRLVSLSLALRLVGAKLRTDPDEAESRLREAMDELAHALEELRELARGIHPAVLTDRGLDAALESLAVRIPLN
ncbi:MAG: histidine kinase, partial [Actinomycetota bacterium]|nr:histidine kinase [Actinomycetota bacterium]